MTPYLVLDLVSLFERQFFSNLDYYFTRSMSGAFDETDPVVLGSCALVSKGLSQGDICLDIPSLSASILDLPDTDEQKLKLPDSDDWITALNASPMVSDTMGTPLVLDKHHRLFLAKYYDFQIRLSKNISQRHLLPPRLEENGQTAQLLESIFKATNPHVQDQKNAIHHSLFHHFTVISGGPGTGKTFVTTQIKHLLLQQAKEQGRAEPKIICVAPTGKAASKMDQGSTIHSVLKPRKDRPGFYYNRENPLLADVVIIDEASMIDIILLTRLLEAISPTAKVILLGDQYQLASVQAGSVFADICSAKTLVSSIFVLEYNFRSKGKSGIENLSKAINNNNEHQVEKILLSKNGFNDVVFENLEGKIELHDALQKYIAEGYAPFVTAENIDSALDRLEDFKVLCAHNSGRYGTLQINHVCENILRSKLNFDIQENHLRQIIMVKTNDYKKGLFNGDTGIISHNKGEASAYIKNQDDKTVQYRVSDLPAHDAAFAITIHKSQGSEFKTVLILLPDRLSPVVTRQLLYTGVTRAKERVIIAGYPEIIKAAVRQTVSHNSGLTACIETHIHDLKKT